MSGTHTPGADSYCHWKLASGSVNTPVWLVVGWHIILFVPNGINSSDPFDILLPFAIKVKEFNVGGIHSDLIVIQGEYNVLL